MTLGGVLAVAAAFAGCSSSGHKNVPSVAALPLVDGARVLARVRQCDRGADAYCSIDLVVVDKRYPTSMDLLQSEKHWLKSHRWTGTGGDASAERAADSPGHKLRVTYATAQDELLDNDLGWIQRPRTIQLALSQSVFDRSPALAVMLEIGVG